MILLWAPAHIDAVLNLNTPQKTVQNKGLKSTDYSGD